MNKNKIENFIQLTTTENMGGVEAARIAFQWLCTPNSKETNKAKNFCNFVKKYAKISPIELQCSRCFGTGFLVKVNYLRWNLKKYCPHCCKTGIMPIPLSEIS